MNYWLSGRPYDAPGYLILSEVLNLLGKQEEALNMGEKGGGRAEARPLHKSGLCPGPCRIIMVGSINSIKGSSITRKRPNCGLTVYIIISGRW